MTGSTLDPMRDADSLTLDMLRKGVAADVDTEVWAAVEKQVAEVGVLGLTGSARSLIEGLVQKHGSPGDPGYSSLHGGGKGGGGKPTVRQMQSAATFLDNHGDVPSEKFAPTGIGNMGESQAKAMIAHARKLGWKEED